jgi:carboxymethylenebutenolidase
MGAYFALEAARAHPDDVAAVVLYYGSGEQDIAPSRAAILGHFADNDPYEDDEWIAGMEQKIRAAGNAITFHTYPDTGHWFAETDRPDAYNPAAATLAWQRTVDFLRDWE